MLGAALATGGALLGPDSAAAAVASPCPRDLGAPLCSAVSPNLWPHFRTPRALLVANALAMGPNALLAATTLEGVYNGEQHACRLYLIQSPGDSFWLHHALPSGIRVFYLEPHDAPIPLVTLLRDFRADVAGAVLTAPGHPDSIDVATTVAGVRRLVAATPEDAAALAAAGIPVRLRLATLGLSGPVATYSWAARHLLPLTNRHDLVMLNPSIPGSLRDEAVASHSFVFYLTSTVPAQAALFQRILAHTPADTPVLGYIPNEGPDVAFLSAHGHFLNASDYLHNGSVWAAMPAPASLPPRPAPEPVAARPGTVYVAFLVSDGDNAQYVQHRMRQVWTGDAHLGAVPEGWTVPPGMIAFAPTILEYYARHLPTDSEMLAGPSGIGYVTDLRGAALTVFARLSGATMRREGLRTVDDWESPSTGAAFARAAAVPSISFDEPVSYRQVGRTVIYGQTSSYLSSGAALFCTLLQQSAAAPPSAPLFLEPLVDAWNLTPTTVLHVAQQLVRDRQLVGRHYVFLTPTELALTMRAYYSHQEAGLPTANRQALPGAEVPGLAGAGSRYPVETGHQTGPNEVTNPSGAQGTAGWFPAYGGQDATLEATTYDGSPALRWGVGAIGHPDWVSTYPAVANGDSYTFSVEVAGRGQVFLDVWDGTADHTTLPVRLTSTFQRLQWTVTIPPSAPGGQSGAAPQLQVREDGAAPVTVYFRDATVRTLSLPPPSFQTLFEQPCVIATP
jgi:hypothetical protein